MNNTMQKLVIDISLGIMHNKSYSFGICTIPDQKPVFVTHGRRFEIVKLWLYDSGKFWNEESFDGYLLLQQGKEYKRSAEFVRTDAEWKALSSSLEGTYDLTCLAICAVSSRDSNTGKTMPLCIKARFTPEIGVVCYSMDSEYMKLYGYEGDLLLKNATGVQIRESDQNHETYEVYDLER